MKLFLLEEKDLAEGIRKQYVISWWEKGVKINLQSLPTSPSTPLHLGTDNS